MNTMSKTELAEKNAFHIERMNTEMGELRDAQKRTNTDIKQVTLAIGTLRNSFTKMETDVEWLKKFFFIVASSSIGGLIMSILTYVRK